MHKPESVLEDEMLKILWDFDVQTEHLVSARITDLLSIKKKEKKTFHIWVFCHLCRPQSENERKQKDLFRDIIIILCKKINSSYT